MELLVVIGLIGLLLAILLPVAGKVRSHARSTKSQANLRSLSVGLYQYADGENAYPCIVADQLYPDIDGTLFRNTYWQVEDVWHGIIFPYFAHDEYLEVFFSPGAPVTNTPHIPGYSYSHSFIGKPRIWSGAQSSLGPDDARPVRISDVQFPSSKAVLWDRTLGFLSQEVQYDVDNNIVQATPIAFVDGSVSNRSQSKAKSITLNRLNDFGSNKLKLHNTKDGVHGRDY